jgi:hypothetical protein
MRRVHLRWCGIAVVALSIFGPPPAAGKLAPSTLSDLIADSDLIMHARVTELSTEIPGTRLAGVALLRVDRVFKGTYDQETVKIEFEPEVHEQFITTVQYERLLFLKKTPAGTYIGTQYGRSYWPLIWVDGAERQLVTPYVYPTNIIAIPDALIKEAEVLVPELGLEKHRVKAIHLKDLIPLLGVEQ